MISFGQTVLRTERRPRFLNAMDVLELIEEGKISRYFRSRKKLIDAGLISHITQRAAGKDVLFAYSDDVSPLIPKEVGRLFRLKAATYSDSIRHPVGAKRRWVF